MWDGEKGKHEYKFGPVGVYGFIPWMLQGNWLYHKFLWLLILVVPIPQSDSEDHFPLKQPHACFSWCDNFYGLISNCGFWSLVYGSTIQDQQRTRGNGGNCMRRIKTRIQTRSYPVPYLLTNVWSIRSLKFEYIVWVYRCKWLVDPF